jgi:hypothetical protein
MVRINEKGEFRLYCINHMMAARLDGKENVMAWMVLLKEDEHKDAASKRYACERPRTKYPISSGPVWRTQPSYEKAFCFESEEAGLAWVLRAEIVNAVVVVAPGSTGGV